MKINKLRLFWIIFLGMMVLSISIEPNSRLGFAASSLIGPQALSQPATSCSGNSSCSGNKENPSPSTDTTPPETTITSYPDDPTTQVTATFEFTCDEGSCTYDCQLDSGGWSPCPSPITYSGISNASHIFQVRAWDESGNVDPSPMSYYWRIGYWVEMGMGSALDGGISNNTGGSYRPSIVIGLDGNPIITWYDWSSSNPEIYVRRWDGSAWVEMGAGSASGGGISNTTYESTYPSIAMGSDGNPVITWKDWVSGGSYETYVRKWNGSAWVEMGTGSASGGGISNNAGMSLSPSVIVSSDGNPIIAWEDNTSGDYEVYIRKWNGSAWVEMGTGSASSGGISNNSGYSGVPSLLLGSDGNPIVAWVDNSSGSGNTDIYIRRWNGSAWMEMGTGSASGGGISNSEMGTSGPFLAMGSDGKPIIAWRDDTLSGPSYDIFVKRWSGSAWVEMGTGSASSGGISNNAGNSEDPSIVIGLDGNPVIVWDDFSGGNDEIYVKRWNGSAWMEMGTGSASAGGISNNAGQSYWAAIAIGPDGRPIVAWYDNTGTDWEIYVLEWGGLIYY